MRRAPTRLRLQMQLQYLRNNRKHNNNNNNNNRSNKLPPPRARLNDVRWL
jgi:hypothetical protein